MNPCALEARDQRAGEVERRPALRGRERGVRDGDVEPAVAAAGAESAWIETVSAARASFAIAARWSTHGPTPASSERVERTTTPRSVSTRVTRGATSKAKACSA